MTGTTPTDATNGKRPPPGPTGPSDPTGPTDPTDGPRRRRGPFGPLEMLDDVQRQAFEAAMRVAGELSALSGDLAGGPWFPDRFGPATNGNDTGAGSAGAGPGAGPGGDEAPRVDVGRLRADVMRAAETFSELMRALLDVGFDAMEELGRTPGPRPTAAASAGGVARLECTVRNDQRISVRGGRPHVSPLVSDGGTLLGGVVTIRPEQLDLEPHERVTLEIDVRVPDRTDPGRYHGLVLIAGLSDSASPITIEVTEVTDAPGAAPGDGMDE